jgi:hypothetical protein
VEVGETRPTFEKCSYLGTGIQGSLPRAPRLQRGAGYMKHMGGLTLGDALDLQVVIRVEEFGASGALPALVAIHIAMLLVVDDSAHCFLPRNPCHVGK